MATMDLPGINAALFAMPSQDCIGKGLNYEG